MRKYPPPTTKRRYGTPIDRLMGRVVLTPGPMDTPCWTWRAVHDERRRFDGTTRDYLIRAVKP